MTAVDLLSWELLNSTLETNSHQAHSRTRKPPMMKCVDEKGSNKTFYQNIWYPHFDILGSGRIQRKDLISRLESGAFLMHFTLFSRFFIPGMYGSAIFSSQLLDQPIEQPMTTNTSKHRPSPTEYSVRCGVIIISSKRYASTHLRCMLDVPENSCVPLLTVTPPPQIFYWRRRRRQKKSIGAPPPPVKITRRAAAEILTSVQDSNA